MLVKESATGRYREAEAKPLSRFGYRFNIENIGRPHIAVIRYPDDKRRYMCVMDGSSYDLTTGVFTGFAQPLSGQMLEIRNIFWPRWQDCSIVFMTWGHGEPAAVESIKIYELEDLPCLMVPGDEGNESRRSIGIQYEDPSIGMSEGAVNRDEWLERVVEYCRFSGQKLFAYPINWYHGPLFPSEYEPCSYGDGVMLTDRRSYGRWTTHPADWVGMVLKRFSEEGLEFQASLTLLRLGSLMEKMNVDIESIKKGEDTINNMLWNDNVQASTQDWTIVYNVRNYPKIVEYSEKDTHVYDLQKDFEYEYIYGEKLSKNYHGGPIFNPLHPVVQDTVIRYIEEIVERYGGYPAFKGISFNMWHSNFLWFGSIHSGYDDYTADLFEKETLIKIPVEKDDPERFSKRYQFLTYICRPAWVEWRCKKIHRLFCKIRDASNKIKPDLRITITLWSEVNIPKSLLTIDEARQLHARLDNYQFYREAGIDIKLFSNEPNFDIDIELQAQRDRGGWGTDGVNTPTERAAMYRDFDFLDKATQDAMKSVQRPGAYIFNSWVEAWGKHMWYNLGPDDELSDEKHANIDGVPPEGILRANSIYPRDDFWWDSQMRITPSFQAGVHFMEHYAHAVAELDACKITRGGLILDTAHSGQIQKFSLAYRALPCRKFETVGESTDPVAVRRLLHEDKCYLYLVNREYYPVSVKLSFEGATSRIVDLANSETITVAETWTVTLGPYELRSFAAEADMKVSNFSVSVPDDIEEALKLEAAKVLKAIESVRERGLELPGMDCMEKDIISALNAGHFAQLRRTFGSYIVLRCRELSE